ELQSRSEAQEALASIIEHYNTVRLHSSLGFCFGSPASGIYCLIANDV
ncbi:MAG: integrase core domain-containing protein, partial [Pirellula sp.]